MSRTLIDDPRLILTIKSLQMEHWVISVFVY